MPIQNALYKVHFSRTLYKVHYSKCLNKVHYSKCLYKVHYSRCLYKVHYSMCLYNVHYSRCALTKWTESCCSMVLWNPENLRIARKVSANVCLSALHRLRQINTFGKWIKFVFTEVCSNIFGQKECRQHFLFYNRILSKTFRPKAFEMLYSMVKG